MTAFLTFFGYLAAKKIEEMPPSLHPNTENFGNSKAYHKKTTDKVSIKCFRIVRYK